jgi:hypothetical protein
MGLEEFVSAFGDGVLDATDAFQALLDGFPAGSRIHLDLQGSTLRLSRPVVLPTSELYLNVEIQLDGDLAERFGSASAVDFAEIFLDGQTSSVERWLARREDAAALRQRIREAVRKPSALYWRMALASALWVTGATLSAIRFNQSSALVDTLQWVALTIAANQLLRLAREERLLSRLRAWRGAARLRSREEDR